MNDTLVVYPRYLVTNCTVELDSSEEYIYSENMGREKIYLQSTYTDILCSCVYASVCVCNSVRVARIENEN